MNHKKFWRWAFTNNLSMKIVLKLKRKAERQEIKQVARPHSIAEFRTRLACVKRKGWKHTFLRFSE